MIYKQIEEFVKQAVLEFLNEGGKGSGRYPQGSGKHPDPDEWVDGRGSSSGVSVDVAAKTIVSIAKNLRDSKNFTIDKVSNKGGKASSIHLMVKKDTSTSTAKEMIGAVAKITSERKGNGKLELSGRGWKAVIPHDSKNMVTGKIYIDT